MAVGLLRDVFPRRRRRCRSERVRASCSEETVPSAQKRRARIHSDPPSARHDEVRHAQPRQSSARHGEAAPAAQPAPTRPLWRGAARSLRLPIAPSQDRLRRDVARPPQSPARTEKTFFGEAWRDRPGGPECPAKTAIGEARRGGPGGPARPAETVVGEAWRGCSGGPARPAKTVLGETRQDSPGCPARPAYVDRLRRGTARAQLATARSPRQPSPPSHHDLRRGVMKSPRRPSPPSQDRLRRVVGGGGTGGGGWLRTQFFTSGGGSWHPGG